MSAIGLVVVLILFMAAPAAAKMTPFFTVAIDPAAPVAGQPMVVVVRTWSDAAHTTPAGFDAAATLDGLLVLRPTTGGSADIPIPLRFAAHDEFRATLIVPSAGDWSLVAFPDRTGWGSPNVPAGYVDALHVTVLSENGSAAGAAWWALACLAAAIVAAAAAIVIVRRRRTGWPGSAA